ARANAARAGRVGARPAGPALAARRPGLNEEPDPARRSARRGEPRAADAGLLSPQALAGRERVPGWRYLRLGDDGPGRAAVSPRQGLRRPRPARRGGEPAPRLVLRH